VYKFYKRTTWTPARIAEGVLCVVRLQGPNELVRVTRLLLFRPGVMAPKTWKYKVNRRYFIWRLPSREKPIANGVKRAHG
jgi:hypothetical protein